MKYPATALILVVLFASAVCAQTWDPEMHLKLKAVGAPRVSPDGKKMVYTVNEAVMAADKSEFVTQIWMTSARYQAERAAHVWREVVHESEMVAGRKLDRLHVKSQGQQKSALSPEYERWRS